MIINTRLENALLAQIKELDPDIDLSQGSNFRDLVVAPLSIILNDLDTRTSEAVGKLTLSSPNALSEAEMDSMARTYLLSRTEGSYHTGRIKIYFSSPSSFSLPKGFTFLAPDGTEYITSSNISITRIGMTLNTEGNFYFVGDIPVTSKDLVTGKALAVGVLLKPKYTITPSPSKVVVSTAIQGGATKESNELLLERIQKSLRTESSASILSLEEKAKDLDSTILRTLAIGAGSQFMTRDRVSYNELDSKTLENFSGVTQSQPVEYKVKEHTAFINNFDVVIPEGDTALPWPEPTDWITEFSDEQYRGVYSLGDAFVASSDEYQIISIES